MKKILVIALTCTIIATCIGCHKSKDSGPLSQNSSNTVTSSEISSALVSDTTTSLAISSNISSTVSIQSSSHESSGTASKVTNDSTSSEDSSIDKATPVEAKVQEVISQIPQGASDYEKAKYVNDYLSATTKYDYATESQQLKGETVTNTDASLPYGAIIQHLAVCSGYAEAFHWFMKDLHIDCYVPSGTTDSGEGHEWNLIKLGDNYYNVDVTWGADYFCMPDIIFRPTHKYYNYLVNIPTVANDWNYWHPKDTYLRMPSLADVKGLLSSLNSGNINKYLSKRTYLVCDFSGFTQQQILDLSNQYLIPLNFELRYYAINPNLFVFGQLK
jgi:Uncharacterized protein involved in cytokinesis, contains TGc (transglutaminase/protease-like) domain